MVKLHKFKRKSSSRAGRKSQLTGTIKEDSVLSCSPLVTGSLTLSTTLPSKGAKDPKKTEHDAFLREFSIPTNLYRYLALRQRTQPLLLQRTLSYLRGKSCTVSARRKLPEVVEELRTSLAKRSVDHNSKVLTTLKNSTENHSPMSISFDGFFDSDKEKEWTTTEASLTTSVEHHWIQLRKSQVGCSVKPLVEGYSLPCNPGSGVNDASKDPLTLRRHKKRFWPAGSTTSGGNDGVAMTPEEEENDTSVKDGDLHMLDQELWRSESSARVQRSFLVFKIQAMEKRIYSKVYDSPPGGRRKSARRQEVFPVSYRASLPLFNGPPSHQTTECHLTSGSYEVRLELDTDTASTESSVMRLTKPGLIGAGRNGPLTEWHSVDFPTNSPAVDEYAKWPLLRFRVFGGDAVSVLPVVVNGDNTENDPDSRDAMDTIPPQTCPTTDQESNNTKNTRDPSTIEGGVTPTSVSYRFLFHGRLEQWTEVADLMCPWCRRNCHRGGTSALLHHLRNWHPRFHFESSVRGSRLLRVEVSVPRDATVGGCHDVGLRRAALLEAPVQRTPGTFFFYRKTPSQEQSDQSLPNKDGNEPSTSGISTTVNYGVKGHHSRQYCHTWSALPVRLSEFDDDSEDEDTLEWLHKHYQRNLDEFTDVNKGEKRIMRLWNSHLIRRRVLGDNQVPEAMRSFVAQEGPGLIQEGLRTNLMLHLVNLADYGLISPEALVTAVAKLEKYPVMTS